jgi:hypothetical protein
MITMRRQLLGLGFVAASSLLAINAAQAMSGPTAIQIDGGPLGALQVSGGMDGYGYFISGTSNTGESLSGYKTSNGANVGSALIELQKTSGELGFTLEVGSNGGTEVLGNAAPGQTSITTFSTGPLYAGYITFSPAAVPGLSVSAGQIGSLEGWESGVDWNNANQLTTAIFDVQNSQSRGISVAYTTGPIAATVDFGDGYDNGVWNYVQALVTYTIDSSDAASLYGAYNLGTTGPVAVSYANDSPVYANSELIGAFYSYTMGSLNLVPEVQYQYTKAISKIGLSKPATDFGAAVFADYAFGTSPYSLGAWAEYFNSHSGATTYNADGSVASPNDFAAFAGPDSEAIGLSVTPTWQYKDLFARADAGYLYLLHNKGANGESYGYGNNGTGRGVFTGTLEAGLLF